MKQEYTSSLSKGAKTQRLGSTYVLEAQSADDQSFLFVGMIGYEQQPAHGELWFALWIPPTGFRILEKFHFGPEEVVDGSMDLERPTYKYDRATGIIIVDQRMHDPSTSSWQTQQKVISVHQKTPDGIQ